MKVCGITNADDASVAVGAGADAIGLIFVPGTPRCVTVETAKAVARVVSPTVWKVGVFVEASINEVNRIAREVSLDVVQLHGDLTPDEAARLAVPFFKVVRVRPTDTRGAIDVEALRAYNARAIVLDTFVEGRAGGTGRTFDWELARPVVEAGLSVLLSGGLTPDNVAEAVRRVRPFGVDVSSGVEARPGCKNHDKVRAFISNAKGAQRD